MVNPNNSQLLKLVYLPGLNGLRAIAALAVVISHITLSLNEFGLNNKIFGTDKAGNASGLDLAGYGVTIFFTLSGFLITFLLLKEKELTKLKIKEFYIRRVLRIWPLYYLYFLVCLIVIVCYKITITPSSIYFYLFLAANIPFILGTALPMLAHYWSLGVEEQFYLFFPQIAKYSNKFLLKTSILLILVLLGLKAVFWFLDRNYDIHIPYLAISVTRFHTMFIGVVGAILYYYKNAIFFAISTHIITQIISWGIYVVHPLLIFCFTKLVGQFNSNALINYVFIYTAITAATIITAYLSYEFYEKQFLKLKIKYSTVKSVNTINS